MDKPGKIGLIELAEEILELEATRDAPGSLMEHELNTAQAILANQLADMVKVYFEEEF